MIDSLRTLPSLLVLLALLSSVHADEGSLAGFLKNLRDTDRLSVHTPCVTYSRDTRNRRVLVYQAGGIDIDTLVDSQFDPLLKALIVARCEVAAIREHRPGEQSRNFWTRALLHAERRMQIAEREQATIARLSPDRQKEQAERLQGELRNILHEPLRTLARRSRVRLANDYLDAKELLLSGVEDEETYAGLPAVATPLDATWVRTNAGEQLAALRFLQRPRGNMQVPAATSVLFDIPSDLTLHYLPAIDHLLYEYDRKSETVLRLRRPKWQVVQSQFSSNALYGQYYFTVKRDGVTQLEEAEGPLTVPAGSCRIVCSAEGVRIQSN